MSKNWHRDSRWGNGLVDWVEGNVGYVSCVFSWQVDMAYQRVMWYRQLGHCVRVGGPAVMMQSSMFEGLDGVEVGGDGVNALMRHNFDATFTSRGCIRDCAFCIVPRMEGEFKEFLVWRLAPIICDNNFLACSRVHFNRVVDVLRGVRGVDFNQGLDMRLLQGHHVDRLAELDMAVVRIAWDHVGDESYFMKAWSMLTRRFPPYKIRVYVLIGFDDTPEEALYRLEKVRQLGGLTTPMRYQPPRAKRRNQFVGKHWTHDELVRYMRYWSDLHHLNNIPFKEFHHRKRGFRPSSAQMPLSLTKE